MRNTSQKYLALWETAGAVFVSVTGSALHFLYAWTKEWTPVALVAAVNESVWEHLKLCVWPYAFFALVEYPMVRSQTRNFLVAKTAGLLVMPMVITAVFYAYTGVVGRNYLVADIGLFVVAVALGFAVSFRIATSGPLRGYYPWVAVVVLIAVMLAFSVLTYFPPELPLFQDPVQGHYGIRPDDAP